MALAFVNSHFTAPRVCEQIATLASFIQVWPISHLLVQDHEIMKNELFVIGGHSSVLSYLNQNRSLT